MALAIDYSCHIGHAYATAPGVTRTEKVTSALDSIGFSIFNAGGSTLLGTLFLSASRSPVFRTFFVLIWGAIFLGLVAGLAVMPALLSIVGPTPSNHHHGHSSAGGPHFGTHVLGSRKPPTADDQADDDDDELDDDITAGFSPSPGTLPCNVPRVALHLSGSLAATPASKRNGWRRQWRWRAAPKPPML
jgi:hypothetical protein